jgi:hypothetical protein
MEFAYSLFLIVFGLEVLVFVAVAARHLVGGRKAASIPNWSILFSAVLAIVILWITHRYVYSQITRHMQGVDWVVVALIAVCIPGLLLSLRAVGRK